MGLAASQAQLLTMTSRMSANELRTQMISEEKRRLATASSAASDKYAMALDSPHMMITNYNPAGVKQTQQLTFNSLNSYNKLNNQYGLVDSLGRFLVSEKEATNFQIAIASADPLTTFLNMHGLEYGTTYFTNMATNADGEATYPGYLVNGEYSDSISIGHSPEELKVMYLGGAYTDPKTGVEKIYSGYEKTLETATFKQFEQLIEEYYMAYDNYERLVQAAIKEDIGDKMSDLETLEKSGATGKVLYDALKNTVNRMGEKSFDGYFEEIKENFAWLEDPYQSGEVTRATAVKQGADNNEIIITANGMDYTLRRNGDNYSLASVKYTDEEGTVHTQNISGQRQSNDSLQNNDKGLAYVLTEQFNAPDEQGNMQLQTITSNERLIIPEWPADGLPDVDGIFVQDISPLTDEDYLEAYNSAKNSIAENAFYHYGLDAMVTDSSEVAIKDAKNVYHTAAARLSQFYKSDFKKDHKDYGIDEDILGPNNELERYKLDDLDFIKERYGEDPGGNFKAIYPVFILDRLFGEHAEPQMAWLNEKGEVDDHKKQWYTNLFERMQKGHKAVEDGCASSPEWIKLQLQNGYAVMEQADFEGEWKPFIATNSTDITEKNNAQAIVIAEAEYNREIAKIQNKDKRLDLQMKALDTEHSVLQNEYNSIQAAMNKNMERVFKYFSA